MEIEHLKIIGTAHVSKNSMEEVKEIIHAEKPDVVAVELDVGRYQKLMREKLGLKEDDQFSVKDLMRGENISLFLISGLLTYLQNKIGDELGVKPGSEMLAAIEAAEEVGAKIALIDRDIRITMQRIIDSMSLREKLRFLFNILLSFFKKDEIEDVESLKSTNLRMSPCMFTPERNAKTKGTINKRGIISTSFLKVDLCCLKDKSSVSGGIFSGFWR